MTAFPNGSAAPPSGTISPSQMNSAYGMSQLSYNGSNQTIAIIDAFNQPNIQSDLTTFDNFYGLAAAPSFRVVNQTGGSSLPGNSVSWGEEISLDVEWAHAIAPGANLVLIEANNSSFGNLMTAANTAATVEGASVASMSFGGREFSGETTYDADLNHPGTSYVASDGDSGSPAQYPSASPYVLSVGGTHLNQSNGTWKSESVWNNIYGRTGGGPSSIEARPSWQNGFNTNSHRGTPDVALDADPVTGVSVYDSYGAGGWLNGVGGTSLSAPIWAGIIALANQGRANSGKGNLTNMPADIYNLSSNDFHDITSGGNGKYKATTGWDFVSGRGTPKANLLVPDLVGLTSGAHGATPQGPSGTAQGGSLGRALVLSLNEPGMASANAVTTSTSATPSTAAAATSATLNSVLSNPSTGVSVGGALPGPTTTFGGDVWRAHSLPDGQEAVPAAAQDNPNPGPAQRLAPEVGPVMPGDVVRAGEEARPVAMVEAGATDAVFAADAWTPLTSDPEAETNSPAANAPGVVIDPAALAGVLVLLGGSWQSLNSQGQPQERRSPKLPV
jgi:subtilase family serine protease